MLSEMTQFLTLLTDFLDILKTDLLVRNLDIFVCGVLFFSVLTDVYIHQ